jgi:large subunit ribosomal protein L5e
MGFIKVVKDNAYYKRFQVKFRRRREGRTDYAQRKRLIAQDKNKYNSPKYRLIVRRTNKDIIAQIAYSKISGDVTMVAAYSHELPKYGIKLGLTNYAAAYATGLLIARRLLQKVRLDKKYEGEKEITGEDFIVEHSGNGPKPFMALLDVGIARTSTGARIFATLKGALDGGINIPHSPARFAGFDEEKQELDAKILRKYIFGGHVADYMNLLSKEDADKYKKVFSRYIKAGIKPGDLESIYKKAHAAIRANPAPQKTEKKDKYPKVKKQAKTSRAQKVDRIKQKITTNPSKFTVVGTTPKRA